MVLIGEDGRASLQYIPRFDAESASNFVASRFDAGNVDDVELLVPDLGELLACSFYIFPLDLLTSRSY